METWDQPLPKKFAEIDRTSIAYTDSGHGEPIVFIHGIPTSSYLWRNVIRGLEHEFRCVAPDLMGLGDLGAPADGRYHMEAQAEKILLLCDSLGFSRFNLVCHDEGGAAAQWIAARHPGRVRRFTLAGDSRYTLGAARHFGGFDRPTCVIRAGNDRFINVGWDWKLYKEIAGAKRFEVIPFAGHVFQEEKPAECAAHIRDFIQDR